MIGCCVAEEPDHLPLDFKELSAPGAFSPRVLGETDLKLWKEGIESSLLIPVPQELPGRDEAGSTIKVEATVNDDGSTVDLNLSKVFREFDGVRKSGTPITPLQRGNFLADLGTDLLLSPPGAILGGRTIEEAVFDANQWLKRAAEWKASNQVYQSGEARKEALAIFCSIRLHFPDWQPERMERMIDELDVGQGTLEVPEEWRGLIEDSSRLYPKGHLKRKEGLEKEALGDFDGAYEKLVEASELFDTAKKSDNNWHPEIGEYRRKKIRSDMERVNQARKKNRDPEGARPGSAKLPDSPQPRPQPKPKPRPQLQKQPQRRAEPVNDETRQLRQRLQQVEAALDSAHRREVSLRAVLRDLLNEKAAHGFASPKLADPPLPRPTPMDTPSGRPDHPPLPR